VISVILYSGSGGGGSSTVEGMCLIIFLWFI
jgi:hypothetical protein